MVKSYLARAISSFRVEASIYEGPLATLPLMAAERAGETIPSPIPAPSSRSTLAASNAPFDAARSSGVLESSSFAVILAPCSSKMRMTVGWLYWQPSVVRFDSIVPACLFWHLLIFLALLVAHCHALRPIGAACTHPEFVQEVIEVWDEHESQLGTG